LEREKSKVSCEGGQPVVLKIMRLCACYGKVIKK